MDGYLHIEPYPMSDLFVQAERVPARVTRTVEASLPLRLSQKWVSYACRMAGVAKPRWSRSAGTWTTTGRGATGGLEAITIARGVTAESVTIDVSWEAADGPRESATARRLVTSLLTGMQWAVRQKALTRTPLE